ncbi:Uncharacterised protein [Achromobacter denitrificans]|uniref:hypothetical protein n=1 Tax=Achromobacter denitrificans TaxID=32002 RepID=UPI000AC05FA0|nr:hypothetical protein [Achromobacter denitrificans]QKH45698.1 hypothetical protein FOC82_31085 [Achromobacter denitrificans]QKH52960.1 hypothetical protein FOC80_27385 [Achromobacter denitrificans]CAB3698852.1 hypothetical protein LMG1231_02480 [Achromobacter denitrificans]SUW33776.1 Uncharacterised protein [Achromobacter denitrificans]
MNARPEIRLTPAQELRMDLTWDVRMALRDGMQEVVRYCVAGENRQLAAHAVYEDSIGKQDLVDAFDAVARAYAHGDTFGRIGELFSKFMDGASAHYVENLADAIEDQDRQLDVSFELPARRK